MRRALEAGGYSTAAIAEMVGAEALEALLDGWPAPSAHQLSDRGHLGTLGRLFAVGVDVGVSELEDLPTAYPEDWADAGLIRIHRGRAHPLVAIDTIESDRTTHYVIADAPRREKGRLPSEDFVAGVSPNLDAIFRLAPRRGRGRVLDAGCRSAPLSLMLASGSGQVVATETAGRALEFAGFNLALNRVGNVELHPGEPFEPVAGEGFDLVVSDRARLVSTDEPDTVRHLSGAGACLQRDGWALLTGQWALTKGETLLDQVGRVLGPTCDAMVLQLRSEAPAAHLAARLRPIARFAPEEADRRFEHWSSDFARREIVEVVTGLLVLHRIDGRSPWLTMRVLPGVPPGDLTGVLAALFQAEEWLGQRREQGEMLRHALRLSPSVLLQPSVRPDGNRWLEDGATWTSAEGLYRTGKLSSAAAAILARCDGQATLGQRFEEWCAAPGVRPPGWDGSREAAMKNLDTIAREMVAMGLLVTPAAR